MRQAGLGKLETLILASHQVGSLTRQGSLGLGKDRPPDEPGIPTDRRSCLDRLESRAGKSSVREESSIPELKRLSLYIPYLSSTDCSQLSAVEGVAGDNRL